MNNYYKLILNIIFLLVFSGWLVVWVLLPTKSYQYKWTLKLSTDLDSTYLREQGPNLLLFSLPVMLIAALGCIYLHLQIKNSKTKPLNSKSKPRLVSASKRPLFVKAPLGVVTTVELCFAVMFVALLLWSFTNYTYVSFHDLYRSDGEKKWQSRLFCVSLWFGYVGHICWAFLFFPVTRGSSLMPLVGLTSESSIKYHIWLAHISNLLFLMHTIGYIIYWATLNQLFYMLEWSRTYESYLAGVIAISFGIVIWVTSLNRVRRKWFEVFFYTHHLYILYIIFYVLHVGVAYLCMILPGIFLFLIDRYLRFLQSRHNAKLLSARVLPCSVIELNFSKSIGLDYNPTSIMFINVPTISKLQWHPFTVISSSNMETDKISILIKSEGSWSQTLYKHLSSNSSLDDNLAVSVEGPYGPISLSFLSHESLVMVSGGSGIAPFISTIRDILFLSTKPNCHIPNILLVCAFKTSDDLHMLDLLLPISASNAEQISQIKLQIEAYVTQEKYQPKLEAQETIQTIFFKANPLDTPISATLGPNNWLWLGAIIASSFVLFLVFLGLVTRYYIYPFDQKTSQYYHYSYRCLWDMFLACVCICLVSSVAFVLSKNRNTMEDKQIKNEKTVSSPELENFPNQSLSQAMNVHFGERPNLKKILLNYKASDVGVLACGPRKMRHEVAKICSSGLADNLHFESISFNW